jgi:hypothetical protein
MNQQPPILEGRPPTDEEKRLRALFNDLEKGQIDYLDQANKRVIELTTALLGLLFALIAFGQGFPPPYLQATLPKLLALATLGAYLLTMLCAFLGVQPRDYDKYEYNLTEMRRELDKITGYKSRWFKWASILFMAGSILLTALISSII